MGVNVSEGHAGFIFRSEGGDSSFLWDVTTLHGVVTHKIKTEFSPAGLVRRRCHDLDIFTVICSLFIYLFVHVVYLAKISIAQTIIYSVEC
jgi:hypothetical protein